MIHIHSKICLCLDIYVNFREDIPLVAEGKAEINPTIRSSVIIYAFWCLIGFWYFQVFTIDWTTSYCRKIVVNGLDIGFSMISYV